MSLLRRVLKQELSIIMAALKDKKSLQSQHMWHVAKDVQEKRAEANFYTDAWPNFTTVISQEFSSRLSEVADLRFETSDREILLQILMESNLITWGKRQIIYFLEDWNTDTAEYLISNLTQNGHSFKKLYDDLMMCQAHKAKPYKVPPIAAGYVVGELRPEHAEHLAKHTLLEYPLEACVNFFRDILKNFYSTAIYKSEDMAVPVSWVVRKVGCVHAFRYTLKDHRRIGLNFVAMYNNCNKGLARGEDLFGEFSNTDYVPPNIVSGTCRSKAIIMQ